MAIDKQSVGTSGNDTLGGGVSINGSAFSAEWRELFGGLGNDVYLIDWSSGATDKVVELPGGGIDKVVLVSGVSGAATWTGTSYVMQDQVENLAVMGTPILNTAGVQVDNTFGDIRIIGNNLNNHITTGSGNDTLIGGLGADTLLGGGGDDWYLVDAVGDIAVEGTDPYFLDLGTGGNDEVLSSVSYTLGSGLENLSLMSAANGINGTGNALNNEILGNAGNNVLSGLGGDDFLYGGSGRDTLLGGDGNDTLYGYSHYYVTGDPNYPYLISLNPNISGLDGGDLLDGGAGNDILFGYLDETLLGGAGNDILYGDPATTLRMDGGAGDDLLLTYSASDTVLGGLGIDTVYVDFGSGPVNYTLAADVERGILASGSTTVDSLTGNALHNYLQGNNGNDKLIGLAGEDVLDGGAGNDWLIGGDGSDSYMVDSIGDAVEETNPGLAGGVDTVFSFIDNYALGNHVENLVLEEFSYLGGAGTSDHGKGNALNNLIIGNSRVNLLEGGAGHDTLDGGTNADTLIGGSGNDLYSVDRTSDIVQELADTVVGGADTVLLVADPTVAPAALGFAVPAFRGTSYTLAPNVENLDASAITHSYDAATDSLTLGLTLRGNAQNNKITGSLLNDTILGGAGIDTMIGGVGNDTYYLQDGGDVVNDSIAGAAGGLDTILFSASMAATGYTMAANVENLYVMGGSGKITGNASDNLIAGNSADNLLEGGAGNDTLLGNFGNDTLTDAGGNNLLDGGAGNDTLKGGLGNDTYVVDSGDGAATLIGATAEDVIVDTGGTADTVRSYVHSFTLGTGLENLELLGNAFNGTGNGANNKITGNGNANKLDGMAGNDTLDGGTGADTMIGGAGNDTFYVDNVGDRVQEDSVVGGGVDEVISTIDFSLVDTDGADTLGGGVEKLTLAKGSATALQGTGNALTNTLTGNEFDNLLDGGLGNDSLIGGDGNDTYFIDSVGDRVKELDHKLLPSAAAGTADVVYATLANNSTYLMDSFVEQFHLLSNGGTNTNVNVAGNASDNFIWGNVGDNSLSGGLGNDVLNGGAGNDKLDGGAGDDVLNGDGLYQDTYDGSWLTGAVGNDTMTGGAGNDTYFVNVGDGAATVTAGAAEDNVIEAALGGIDTVKLVGSTISSYTLNTEVENLDASGLSVSSFTGIGNAKDNVITGLSSSAYNETLVGGDGNDLFRLAPTNGANDTVRGGNDTQTGGASTTDSGKRDAIHAKADTSGALTDIVANINVRQIEAITLDVSNMTDSNDDFTWNFTNLDDTTAGGANFSGNPASGGLAPLFTITGGITDGQTTSPDASGIAVGGNITLTGLTTTPTYVLHNYNQTSALTVTTTLTLANATGTADALKVILDNHSDGGLASAGIETLFLTSTGDVLDNSNDENRLNVSLVTHTTAGGFTLIDATGDSSLRIEGLQDATGPTAAQRINLHDFSAESFTARLNNTAGTDYLHLGLNNVETFLATNGSSLENLNIDATGSVVGNVLNANNSTVAGTTYVSGDSNSSLTLNQWTGTISTDAVASGGFSTGFTGKLDIVGSSAITLTADGGDISFRSFRDSSLTVPTVNDSFTFNLAGVISSLNNLDSIDGGLGTDTLAATVDGLDAASTGELHIDNVENLDFTVSAASSSIDMADVTGLETMDVLGSPGLGVTLTLENVAFVAVGGGVLDAQTFFGSLTADLSDSTNSVNIYDAQGHDDITGSAFNDFFYSYGGNDLYLGEAGDDTFYLDIYLNANDTVDGGLDYNALYFTDFNGADDDLDHVSNIDYIGFSGGTTASIATVDALVAAGAVLTVNGNTLATSFVWDGSLETDGHFSVTGGIGTDTLIGGAGNDTLIGGDGVDTVSGGAGDDRISMAVSTTHGDDLDGGSGNDMLVLTGAKPAGNITYMFVDLSAIGTDQLAVTETITLTSYDTHSQINFEHVDASGTSGTFYLDVGNTALTGSRVIGTGNGDGIDGNTGDDTIDGGAGADFITGGDGDDIIYWNLASADTLDGDNGSGNLGIDTLVLTNSSATVTVDLSASGDQVSSSANTQTHFDHLDASAIANALNATAAAAGSSILGGSGSDTLTGGAGADTLVGNDGNDTITGGGGSDILTGGDDGVTPNDDHFVFNTALDPSAYDVITDFTGGTGSDDIIDLDHSIFSAITTAGSAGGTALSVDEFAWGDMTSSNTAGVVIVYNNVTGNLYYDADADGAETGLLIAHLDGTPGLAASDIHVLT